MNIRKQAKIFLCSLCVTVFITQMGIASVMIPDNNGKLQPLSQIDDIMRHVTGATTENLYLPKQSLLMVNQHKNGSDIEISSRLFMFDPDGVRILSGDTYKDTANSEENWAFIPGIHPATFHNIPDKTKKISLNCLTIS